MTPTGQRRTLLIVGAVAGAAGLLAGPTLWQRLGDSGPPLGDTAFPDLTGTPRRLSDWPAGLLVLNFWATWCAPCREEIPLLVAARRRHAGRGVEVIGIAIDLAKQAADYAKAMAIDYPVLIAEKGGIDLMRKLGNSSGGLPFTVLVRRGEVSLRKLGAFTAPELEEAITRALA